MSPIDPIDPIDIRIYFDKYTYNVGLYGVKHLSDCYNKCSAEKKDIWKNISSDCFHFNGHFLSIITCSRYYFTAGYYFIKDGEYYFKVFTPSDSGVLHLGQNDIIELKRQRMFYD